MPAKRTRRFLPLSFRLRVQSRVFVESVQSFKGDSRVSFASFVSRELCKLIRPISLVMGTSETAGKMRDLGPTVPPFRRSVLGRPEVRHRPAPAQEPVGRIGLAESNEAHHRSGSRTTRK